MMQALSEARKIVSRLMLKASDTGYSSDYRQALTDTLNALEDAEYGHLQLPPIEFEGDPVAHKIEDQRTPKQGVAIRAIAHAARANSEHVSLALFGCRPDELTRPAASVFIDYLKSERFRKYSMAAYEASLKREEGAV